MDSGEYQAGDELPAEVARMEQCQVSRGPIRQALCSSRPCVASSTPWPPMPGPSRSPRGQRCCGNRTGFDAEGPAVRVLRRSVPP
ncbi:GntR family transcriptional regulator [Gordonia sp. NB41Y]|uniref:GntR family transcriptional regulator n=1 Tax=Gordonia sp. NB41Y TaxID=875808 RepID=UPI00273CA467|nr:GntR family transcriptional regulator [Gordonia sp. NB41Y]WLP93254.1 GntR family transcriptional regulator [Gordonia sp. NB41Y]